MDKIDNIEKAIIDTKKYILNNKYISEYLQIQLLNKIDNIINKITDYIN